MIFDEQIALRPNNYPWTRDAMVAMWKGHWSDSEFTFTSDKQDFNTRIEPQLRDLLVRTLSAISQIEVAPKSFWANLGDNLPQPCFRDLGYVLGASEVIHNSAYARLLDVLGIYDVFESNLNLDWMKGRVAYLKKYTRKFSADERQQFLYSIILFTLFIENVSLFSQFYIIYWFRRRGMLNDTSQQTDYTLQEELLHAKVGVEIINTIKREYPYLFNEDLKMRIRDEANEAYIAESKVIDWIVGDVSFPSLSASVLKAYVANRINTSLEMIGITPVLLVDQEILKESAWFDVVVNSSRRTDFFNKKPVDYALNSQSFKPEDLD